MKVLIDADGCPVVDITVRLCHAYGVPCTILCDTAHRIQREGTCTKVLDKGSDSVDFALVNMTVPGDIVITQDYGLASMCLAKGVRILHQDGWEYTPSNIDGLLMQRHTAQRLRRAGKHPKGPKKRTHQQDIDFENALSRILQTTVQG